MNILYHIGYFTRRGGGVYQYSLNLLNIIAKENTDDFFYLTVNEVEEKDEDEIRRKDIQKIINENKKLFLITFKRESHPFQFKINYTSLRIIGIIFRLINIIILKLCKWLNIKQSPSINNFIKKHKIDLIHIPFQFNFKNNIVPSISTIHDVQELFYPQFFTASEREWRAYNNRFVIESSNSIIVNYNQIKDDIIKFFNKEESKIHLLFIDLRIDWFKKVEANNSKEYVFSTKNYILQPASTWAHKNHLMVIHAINEIKQKHNKELHYVSTGNLTEHYSEIELEVKKLGISHLIHFLGLVSETELKSLYLQARAFIMPSLYEGGSIPLCEAIQLNIPLIASDIPTVREIINNTKFLFDPTDLNDVVSKIMNITFNEDFRIGCLENNKLILENRNDSGKYSNLKAIYESTISGL